MKNLNYEIKCFFLEVVIGDNFLMVFYISAHPQFLIYSQFHISAVVQVNVVVVGFSAGEDVISMITLNHFAMSQLGSFDMYNQNNFINRFF